MLLADVSRIIRKRSSNNLRMIKVTFDPFSYADSSVLIELDKTKVFCSVSLQAGVPSFLRGKGLWWLTADYTMLSHATLIRSARDGQQKNGRSVEIARIIGRCFRSVVDLTGLSGEKTIYCDVDVLQADGGTRVAALLGLSLALFRAQKLWHDKKIIKKVIMQDMILALSVGVVGADIILDPDFEDDLMLDADFNIIITHKKKSFIEIQGGAEKAPLSFELFNNVQKKSLLALDQIGKFFDHIISNSHQKVFTSQFVPVESITLSIAPSDGMCTLEKKITNSNFIGKV